METHRAAESAMPFLVCFEREVAIVKTEKVGKDQGKRKKAEMGEIASTTRQRPLETAKAHKTSRFWPARKESKQALLASEEKIKGNNFMFRAGGCLESRVERSLTTKASKPNTTRGNSTPLQPRTPKTTPVHHHSFANVPHSGEHMSTDLQATTTPARHSARSSCSSSRSTPRHHGV